MRTSFSVPGEDGRSWNLNGIRQAGFKRAVRVGSTPARPGGSQRLEPYRHAAQDAPADLVVVERARRQGAPRQLHVELHGPFSGQVENHVEVLGEHQLEALELRLPRRRLSR